MPEEACRSFPSYNGGVKNQSAMANVCYFTGFKTLWLQWLLTKAKLASKDRRIADD